MAEENNIFDAEIIERICGDFQESGKELLAYLTEPQRHEPESPPKLLNPEILGRPRLVLGKNWPDDK